VLAANGYDAASFSAVLAAIKASNAPLDILDRFIASLPILGIVEAMQQFNLQVPYTFAFVDPYVIVHGPSALGAPSQCGPVAGSAVTSSATSAITPVASGTPNGFTWDYQHQVTAVSTTTESGEPPLGYYFPNPITFQPLGTSIVSPGVVASDEGDALLFHWGYQLSAKPNQVNVTIDIANTQISVDAPMMVGGVAGVSMEVGCVSVPLLSSSMMGDVKPCTFTMQLALTETGTGPAIVALCSLNASVKVTFYSPPMIDLLLNVVMGSVGDRVVSHALQNLVNQLNFKVVDLSILNYLNVIPSVWNFVASYRTDSVLVGAEQRVTG
jgi:hypothetical protein